MKHTAVTEGTATVFHAEGDVSHDASFEHGYTVPDSATHAVVLMERLTGQANLDVYLEPLSTEARDELSILKQVKLRFLQLPDNTEEVVIRIKSATKAAFRVTVAFFKREIQSIRKNFSCKTCKQLCKLALSALLAHLGVPYLNAETTAELPGIAPVGSDPEDARALRALADALDMTPEELKAPIPVLIGQPVPVGQECKDILLDPARAPQWVNELFDLIHPKAIAAIRMAVEIVDGYIDATDRVYTFSCESIGMCTPKVDSPMSGAA